MSLSPAAVLYDSNGNPINASNPLPVLGNALVVQNAIQSLGFDLAAAPFSATTAIAGVYVLDRIELNFTTTASRNIVVTSAHGTELLRLTANTGLHVEIDAEEMAFKAGDHITVAITQTSGACLVDVVAVTKTGSTPPLNPNATTVQLRNASSVTVNPATDDTLTNGSQKTQVTAFPSETPYAGGLLLTSGTGEPRTTFYDPFEGVTIDTDFRWETPTGAGAPTQANTELTFNTGTTGSRFGKLFSRPKFNAIVPGFFQHSWAVKIESGTAVTGAHRFWGMGTGPTTPTAASPLTDAIGFEVLPDGVLYACVYRGGTNIHRESLAAYQPTDGEARRYICQVRTDRIYWGIEGLNKNLVRSTAIFKVPNTQVMPLLVQCVNGTVQASAPTLKIIGAVGADTACNATQLADGELPFHKAAITVSRGVQVQDSMVYLTSAQAGYAAFNTTTEEISVASGTPLSLLVENPAGSTKNIRLWRVHLSNEGRGVWRRYRNVTVATRGTALVNVNRGGGSNEPQARGYQGGQFTLSGGAAPWGGRLAKVQASPSDASATVDEHGTIVLLPGQNALWAFTPRSGSSNVAVEVVWWEESKS